MNALFKPSADLVDDGLWIETPQTIAATASLWRLLDISRRTPRPWVPHFVLCGVEGVGKTALVERFRRAAQRNVSCSLVARATEALPDKEEGMTPTLVRAAWVQRMVRDHGGCPSFCQPAGWLPDGDLDRAIEASLREHPSAAVDMSMRPDAQPFMGSWVWRSPGNQTHDAVRRTSLVFVDRADRLLALSAPKRRACLEYMRSFDRRVGHAVIPILVGSPELADAVAELGTTQVISLEAMDDVTFAEVAAMTFGTRDPIEIATLQRASGGSM